jgi:hypothetical protein
VSENSEKQDMYEQIFVFELDKISMDLVDGNQYLYGREIQQRKKTS